MKKTNMILIFGFLVVGLMAVYVLADPADPSGPDSINVTQIESFNTSQHTAQLVNAEAGNVTQLSIHGLTQTLTWQGYYGDVTGTITLDDAQNNTMYNWEVAEPQGEIYASNTSTVTWANIKCVNYQNDVAGEINLTILETMYGLATDDLDGVNETFNEAGTIRDGTNHPTIYVGTYTITAGTCPATDTYQNDSSSVDNHDFVEILLTDNNSIVYTTIIENKMVGNDTDKYGFDSVTHDFQMLVGENGHAGDDSVTPYYFFVELE